MPWPTMHPDELPIDEHLVRTLLQRQLPHLAALPIRPVDSTGTVNALYRLGEDLVVRLPRTPRWHDLDREVCWLATLAPRLPLPIPEVVAVGGPEPDADYPWPWAVFRWIEGRPWRLEDVDDRAVAADTLAGFIAALQAVDPVAAPCADPGHLPSLARHDEAVRRATAAAGDLVDGPALLRAWQTALAVPKWQGRRPLLHADLLAGNVLVRDGRPAAVIDWSGVLVGDPARELTAAWNLFDAEGRAALRRALPFDDDTWARARGWTLVRIANVAYYATTNPRFSEDARRVLTAVLADR